MNMKRRDCRDYFQDIFSSIEDIILFTGNLSFDSFGEDKKTIYAVIKCFEIIGEATKKIPKSFRLKYPSIPWKRMAGMRDKMIHEYFGTDVKIIWKTAREDVPPLKSLLKKALKDLGIKQAPLPFRHK